MTPSLVRRPSRRALTRRPALIRLEDRCTPATIAWDGGPGGNGTDFLLPANWAGDVLPGPNDDATVAATGTSPAIALRNTVSLRSLTNSRQINITGNGTVGPVTMTLSNGGRNTGVIALTSADGVYDATLAVSGGTLINQQTIRGEAGAGGVRTISLTGNGRLNNEDVISAATADLTVDATGGSAGVTSTGSLAAGTGRSLTVVGGTANSFGGLIGGSGLVRLRNLTTAAMPAGGLAVAAGATFAVDNSTLNGPGTLSLPFGGTLLGESPSTVNGPVTNAGTVLVRGGLALLGTTTATAAGALLVVEGNGTYGPATATVANFTNSGDILMRSVEGVYDASLTVAGGTLTNQTNRGIFALAGTGGLRTVTLGDNGRLTNAGAVTAFSADLAVNVSGTGAMMTSTADLVANEGHSLTVNGGAANSFRGTVQTQSGAAGLVRLRNMTAAIPAGGLAVQAGATLALDNSTVNGPGTLSIAVGGTLLGETATTVNGPVTNSDRIRVLGGLTLRGTTTNSGTLSVIGNGTYGPATATVANFTNGGEIRLNSFDGVYDASLIVEGGTLTNQLDKPIYTIAGTGGLRTVTLGDNGRLSNAGFLIASDADLTVTVSGAAGASVTSTGSLRAENGRSLTINGGTANSFSGLVDNGNAGGIVRLRNMTAAIPAGGLAVEQNLFFALDNATVNGPGTLSIPAGATLLGENPATVNGPVANSGGMILVRGGLALLGTTTATAGSVLAIEGNGTYGPATATVANFTNGGEIQMTAAGGVYDATLNVVGGTLNNQAGKTIFAIAGAGGLRTIALGANGGLNNAGFVYAFSTDLAVNVSGAGAAVTSTGSLAAGTGHSLTVNGGAANSFGGFVQTPDAGTVRLRNMTAAVPAGGLAVQGGVTLTLDNSTVNGPGTLSLPAGATLLGETASTVNGPVTNGGGTILVRGGLSLLGATTAAAGSVLRAQGNGTYGPATATVANFTNAGLIELTSVDGVNDATLTIAGGTLTNQAAGTLTALAGTGGSRTVSFGTGGQLANQGLVTPATANLTLNLSGTGATASNTGTVLVPAARTLTIVGSTFANAAGGTVAGSGTIDVGNDTLTGAGSVSPGTSPGRLTLNGALNLGGPLVIELNGTTAGTGYDQLAVNGTVTLSGATLSAIRNFAPQPGNTFTILAKDGTDPVVGTFAGLPEAASVTVNGHTFRISYVGGTGNDIVLTHLAAPAAARVASFVMNAGQTNLTQRSKVTSITVTFDQTVTFVTPGNVAAAFGLSRIGGSAVGGFTATANVVGGVTVVTLTGFTGTETEFTSLADGRYALVVRANQIAGSGLDGNGDGTAGDDYTLTGTVANKLFRLFGDLNADGVINGSDYGPFGRSFGAPVGTPEYLAFFDFDGDGVINAFDGGQIKRRFGSSVP